MAQQTSVEYLFEQVCNLDWNHLEGEKKLEIFEQSKQMEKEQKKNWHSENPNKDGEYICRMNNGYIKMCHYVNGIWYDMWDTGIKGTVKEWMNIPYDNL